MGELFGPLAVVLKFNYLYFSFASVIPDYVVIHLLSQWH